MKKKTLKLMALLMAAALTASLTACGNAADTAVEQYNYADAESAAVVSEEYEEEAEYGYDNGSGIDLTAQSQETQKLVYRCQIELETLDYSATMASVKDVVDKYQALIQSESTSDNVYDWTDASSRRNRRTYLTIRVPSESYQDFIGSIGESGHVASQSQQVENITRAYSDQSVYVEALKTQETRLLEMMKQAETVEDMITIESRLTEVQTELTQAQQTLAGMDTDVAYSTVELTISEVTIYTPDTETFGERFVDSFGRSFSNFLDVIGDIIIALIYLLPFLILIAVVALILVLILRTVGKKGKTKRAAKARAKAEAAMKKEEMAEEKTE